MKRLRQFLYLLIIVIMPAFSPVFAYAQATARPVDLVGSKAASLFANLHTRCDSEVDIRVTQLSNSIAKVNAMVKLSASEKQQYIALIQSNITGLNAVKAKCDADTDSTTLVADTRSVFTTFRVYAEFLPQTAILTAADKLSTISGLLSDLATKLQTRISTVQSQGKDVTNLLALLTDMQMQIANAQMNSNTAMSQVSPIQPTTYNANPVGTHATFVTQRGNLFSGLQSLKKALLDANQIRIGLKAFETVVNSASGSAIPLVPTVGSSTSSSSAK